MWFYISNQFLIFICLLHWEFVLVFSVVQDFLEGYQLSNCANMIYWLKHYFLLDLRCSLSSYTELSNLLWSILWIVILFLYHILLNIEGILYVLIYNMMALSLSFSSLFKIHIYLFSQNFRISSTKKKTWVIHWDYPIFLLGSHFIALNVFTQILFCSIRKWFKVIHTGLSYFLFIFRYLIFSLAITYKIFSIISSNSL